MFINYAPKLSLIFFETSKNQLNFTHIHTYMYVNTCSYFFFLGISIPVLKSGQAL